MKKKRDRNASRVTVSTKKVQYYVMKIFNSINRFSVSPVGLKIGIVDGYGHVGYQDIFTLAAVPLVVRGGDALALVSIADAHVLLPF